MNIEDMELIEDSGDYSPSSGDYSPSYSDSGDSDYSSDVTEDSYDSEDDEEEEFVAKGSSYKKSSNSKFLLIVFMFDVSLTEFLKISSSPHYHTSILLFYLLRTLSSLSPQTLSSLFSPS